MIHGTETEYSSKMTIELDGSKFSTNNGTTNLIEVSRNLYHREVSPSFRSRNLVSRVGHKILETIPPTRQQYSYVYLSKSLAGTNRALTIRRTGVHPTRGDVPGEDLLPAQEASSNPALTLNDPR